jgi:hypothetical protein
MIPLNPRPNPRGDRGLEPREELDFAVEEWDEAGQHVAEVLARRKRHYWQGGLRGRCSPAAWPADRAAPARARAGWKPPGLAKGHDGASGRDPSGFLQW